MAYFSVNMVNRTVTIHKNNCKVALNAIEKQNIDEAIYGIRKGKAQVWFSEKNFDTEKVKVLLNNRDYGKVFCSNCF